jgi:16S rRNA (guanine966-N2)-methyltransferase
VREAIFSALGSRLGDLDGMRVLDLYAGSGALGLEALSRGAAHVTFVESGRRAADVIARNTTSLGVPDAAFDVFAGTVERYIRSVRAGERAALILSDPPYRIDAATFRQVLEALAASGALEDGACIVYEHATGTTADWPEGFRDDGTKTYGGTEVSFAFFER